MTHLFFFISAHYADGRPVSSTIKNTAETVLFFDKLFDSVNGAATFSKNTKGKPLRAAVTATSPHHEFWQQAIKKLKTMKYVDANGKPKSVPSIENFITTLKSYMRLWQILKNEGVKIMRPRYFNSDPIENFFRQIRAYNYRNNDPTSHSFNCTFKSLLITRIIKFHNNSFNCEDDSARQVISIQKLFNEEQVDAVPGHPKVQTNVTSMLDEARRERIKVHSRAYTAGWVIMKIFKNLNVTCRGCKSSFTTSEITSIHDWISCREYNKAKKNSLSYPSEGIVRSFGAIVTETNEYLEHSGHENNISENIKAVIMSKYSFDFVHCAEHKTLLVSHFVDLTVRFSIVNWCNTINKILKGTDIHRLHGRDLPPTQKKAFDKFKKKLRNKSFNK